MNVPGLHIGLSVIDLRATEINLSVGKMTTIVSDSDVRMLTSRNINWLLVINWDVPDVIMVPPY